MIRIPTFFVSIILGWIVGCMTLSYADDPKEFPYGNVPDEKPSMPLSAAMQRVYDGTYAGPEAPSLPASARRWQRSRSAHFCLDSLFCRRFCIGNDRPSETVTDWAVNRWIPRSGMVKTEPTALAAGIAWGHDQQ